MITLNQNEALFRSFAQNHAQIKTFGIGDEWELTNLMKGDIATKLQYPIMFCVLQGTTISSSRPNEGSGELTRNYTFLFADLVVKGETNELEVLSDQEQIAIDFINYLAKADIGEQMLVRNSSLNDFTERFEDWITGWAVTVSLRQPHQYSSCNIPFNGSVTVPSECLPVTIYDVSDNSVITTIMSGGVYGVLQVSAIDGGAANTIFTNTIIAA